MHTSRTEKKFAARSPVKCDCDKFVKLRANVMPCSATSTSYFVKQAGTSTSPADCRAKGDGPAVNKRCRCAPQPLGGFGVCVDLSCFFSDERRECWMWVEARRPVQWLVVRLSERLCLARPPACLALLAPQGLLHPADPLALLCPGDTIRVVPVETRLFRRETYVSCGKGGKHECLQTCDDDSCQVDDNSHTKLVYGNENESYCSTKVKSNCIDKRNEKLSCNPKNCCTRAIVACPETRAASCSADPAPLHDMKQRVLEMLYRSTRCWRVHPVTALWCVTRRRARSRRVSCTPSLCEDAHAPVMRNYLRRFTCSKPRYSRC